MKGKLVGLAAGAGLTVAYLAAPGWVERKQNGVLEGRAIAVSQAAQSLHATLRVADLHCDMLLWGREPLERSARGQVDVPRLAAGNVALEVFSAVTQSPRGLNTERNDAHTFDMLRALTVLEHWPSRTWESPRERALYQAERLEKAAARSRGALSLVRSRADLADFLERRRSAPMLVAGVLAIEGMHTAQDGLADADRLADAGFRMMGLAHFFDNRWAGSAHGVEKYGLTEEGRQLVARLEEKKVLIDLAHASPRTIADVLAIARRPLVVSHTGVKGTCPGTRNLDDDQLRGVAATGGVVGIGFWDTAVCDASPRGIARAIRYAVERIGPEHIALGSDFDGAVQTPFDAAGLAQLTQALLDESLPVETIRAVMGENVLRLLGETLPDEAQRP